MRLLALLTTIILLAGAVSALELEQEAERVLYHNSYPQGILAGSTHFSDLWARDALYAGWGALEEDIIGPTKGTLTTLSRHQSAEGQIPLRVGSQNMLLAFMGVEGPQGAVYRNDKGSAAAIDPNCLYVITMLKYVERTGDQGFADDHRNNITAAMEWLADQDIDGDGLLDEGHYASWDDAIKKEGASIYSNSCYYGALNAASELIPDSSYADIAEDVNEEIDEQLWDDERGYYLSWEASEVMDVPGNLFAIHYGVADDERSGRMLGSLASFKEEYGHSLPKTNYPEHPWTDIYFPFIMIGMGDYHDTEGPYWPWIAALEAKVRKDAGQEEEAHTILRTINEWTETSGGLHETYDAPGEPLDRLFYDSEQDFSWSAGMIIYATKDRS